MPGFSYPGESYPASIPFDVCAGEVSFEEASSALTGRSWVELDHVDAAGAATTYLWSQVDQVDDADYYGGYKEGRVIGFGDVSRGLSDERGQFESTEFSFVVSDHDRTIRALLASAKAKYFQNRTVVIRMIDDENRRLKNVPRVLSRGIVRAFKPLDPLHFEFRAGDFLASKFGAGNLEKTIPYRRLSQTDFPNLPSQATGSPVPIGYGHLSDLFEESVVVNETLPPLITSTDNIPTNDPHVPSAAVVGGAGTSTYEYLKTVLPPISMGIGPDPTNPAEDNDHRQEVIVGKVVVTNAPSGAEAAVNDGRFVRLTWGNYSEGWRQRAWGAGAADRDNGGHGDAYFRIYGRTPGQPWVLLVGGGHEGQTNSWDDHLRAPRSSSQAPVSRTVVVIAPGPGSTIIIDRGRGIVPATYVGRRAIAGVDWHEFVVCGHAIKEIEAWYCGGVRQLAATADAGGDFLIPGYAGWTAAIGSASYRDYNGRRYTVLYAKGDRADKAISGEAPLTVNLTGIEDKGDGTGTLIEPLADIYKHFAINFGFQSWESGAWLTAPSWAQGFDCPAHTKKQVDEASFDTMRAVHGRRITGGYPGAIMFGAPTDAALNLRDALARLNISCDCQCGFNKNSQFFVSILDEGIAVLNAAKTYAQTHDIVAGSFDLDAEVDKVENTVVYRFARRFATAAVQTSTAGFQAADWLHEKTISDQEAIDHLKETKQGPTLDLWGVRDATVAKDIAQRRLLEYKEAPLPVKLTTTLKGLGNEIGDVITVDHIGGTGAQGWAGRPLRIMRQITNPSKYTVTFEALDVDRFFAGAFILGDETTLAASWPGASAADRRYGYLGDDVTGAFSTGEPAKRLR